MNTRILFTALAVALATVACKEKETRRDIIVPPPPREAARGTQQMTQTRQQRTVEWLGARYTVSITRSVDRTLPLTRDEGGHAYYDNAISLRVTRQDGSQAYERRFTKSDFEAFIADAATLRDGALLGIVFDRVDGSRLRFAASVGSPDMGSDEFVPLTMTLDRFGNTAVTIDTRLDTDGDAEAATAAGADDDGV